MNEVLTAADRLAALLKEQEECIERITEILDRIY